MNTYLLFKSLHLIAVVSWMAGLLYLPRIFVYHVENKEKKETTDIFILMEKRLYNYIMRPAMLLTWAFGLILIYLIGFEVFSNLWMQIKLVLVLFLSILLGIKSFLTKDNVGGIHEEFGVEATGIGWLEIKNLGFWIVLSTVAWFGTTYIGFEPTMTACLATGLIFCGLRSK